MRYAAATDTGGRRSINEDGYFADGSVFAVADGMGGHLAGEVASELAIESLKRMGGANPARALLESFRKANKMIFERAGADEDRHGMGTTLTACIVDGRRLHIAHAGDSRLYRLRGGKLKQLTKDHSLVAQMVEKGHLTPEEAASHPQRSVITRALGAEQKIDVDTKTKEMAPGDRYLLATDGLTAVVDEEEVAEVIAAEGELEAATKRLIELANARGGPDNITVVVFDPEVEPKRRTIPWRAALLTTAALALLAAGGWLAWRYATNGVYVGVHNGKVAVYRGVPGDFAGFKLQEVVRETDIQVDRLPEPYKKRLEKGMPAESFEKADKTVADLAQLDRVKNR